MVPFFINLLIMVSTIMTIFHCCRLDIPQKKKIIIVILILLTTIIGVIVYWIWFAIKKPAVLRTANKFSNSDRQVIGMECKTTSIDAVENADEKKDEEDTEDDIEDEPDDQELFDKAMDGPNGPDLRKAYDKMMDILVLKANGECKHAGFTGILFDYDRAKKIAKIDNEIVLPALGNTPETYKAWWMEFYEEARDRMITGQNKMQAHLVFEVYWDACLGDSILEQSGAFEYMKQVPLEEKEITISHDSVFLNKGNGDKIETYIDMKITDYGKKMKIRTKDNTVTIKYKEKGNKNFFEIQGAYKYFRSGLSDDEMVREAEIIIAIPSLIQMKTKYLNKKSAIEEYELPSLSKLEN